MTAGREKKKYQIARQRQTLIIKALPVLIIALPPKHASSSITSTSTEDIQTLTLPSTSAHSSVSTTIIPQKSSAYFHQSLPLEAMLIN